MAFTVIQDVEKGVAALIDPELGRALGPIALGEEAVNLLEKFAGAHGVDPATIPTPELELRWKDFVSALSSDVHDLEGAAVKVADEVLHPGSAHAGAPAPAEPELTQAAPAGAVPDTAAVEASQPAQVAAQAPADPAPAGERVMPVTSAKAGFAICPTCDGWGEVAIEGGVKPCPTCGGQGEVPAHEEPEHAPTAT